jgi:uncharacterized protein (TIGR02271 family)
MSNYHNAFLVAVIILAAGCSSSRQRSGLANAQRITPLENRSAVASTGASRYQSGPADSRGSSVQSYATGSAPGRESGNDVTEIPLYREELQVGKRTVPKGGVVLRKIVETDQRSEPVQLRREEIVIERINAEEAQNLETQGGNAGAFQDREVLVELNREVPTVEKSAVVTEVVRARKVIGTRNETISETLRREEIDIDRSTANNEQSEASGSSPAREQGSSSSSGAAARVNTSAATTPATDTAQEQADLYLHQEQLSVGKRVVPAGRVILRKNVTQEQVSRPIELREEDVRIERETVTNATARETAFAPREVFIPLQQEVPVVEKQIELSEVIRARKQIDTEQRVISDEVRRERVEVGETRSATGAPPTTESESGRESAQNE